VFLSIIEILLVFFYIHGTRPKYNSFNTKPHAVAGRYFQGFKNSGSRNYSTSRKYNSSNNKLLSKRKTLTSPKSRAYIDIYAGRGIPKHNNEPV
jgi:hypothetical protein